LCPFNTEPGPNIVPTSAATAHLTILGGGPAGLAAGHFARKAGLPFILFEAADRTGGNAVTFQEGPFRFDSGAHRFHARDQAMTEEVQHLIGPDLLECDIPSVIFDDGRWVGFPLRPVNLFGAIGPLAFARATASLLRARLFTTSVDDDFEAVACHTYGKDIATRYLLGYSEKLWGLPCRQLSPAVAGARLRGLSLSTFLLEAFRQPARATSHLDGRFYYPRLGFGMIAERLAESCGFDRLRTQSRVSRILHDGSRITAVEINRSETVSVDEVCCTLPLPLTATLLSPSLPDSVLDDAHGLRFRNIMLVALILKRPSATKYGSVYFPAADSPVTRVYEPKNRSADMAPPDRTMLVAEVPCDSADSIWRASDDELIGRVKSALAPCGWFSSRDVTGAVVKRMAGAYPVLETGTEQRVRRLLTSLERFANLHVVGRNGLFTYAHTHTMLRFGFETVARVRRGNPAAAHGRVQNPF
jgi:protoporphyrinogen oxidase